MPHYTHSVLLKMLALAMASALLSMFSLVYLPIPAIDLGPWVAGSLGLTVMLVGGQKYWPGILAGTIAGYLAVRGWSEEPLRLAAYACNAMTPLLAVWVLAYLHRRGLEWNRHLYSIRDYLLLGTAAGCGALVSALSANILLGLGGLIQWQFFPQQVLHWWMGDFLGIVLFAPLFLIWSERPGFAAHFLRTAEALFLALLVFLCGQIVFHGWFSASFGPYVHDEWLYLFVVWAAVRFGRHGVAVLIVLSSLQGGLAITEGQGLRDSAVIDLGYIDYWLHMALYSLVGSTLAVAILHLERTRTDLDCERTLLRGVMDSIPDHIFFKDTNSRYLGCNKAFANLHGITEHDIMGLSDQDLFDGEQAELYLGEDAQVLVEQKPRFTEEFLLIPGGEHRLVEKLKTPYFDAEGKVLGIIGVLRDITRRDLSERREKLANDVLRHLTSQESLPQMLTAMLYLLEQDTPRVRGSILLLDEDEQCVMLGSAPSMPDYWRQAVNGMPVGDESFPCTNAARTGNRCICEDAQYHPAQRYRELATRASIGACWTEPIKSHSGSMLGVVSFHLAESGAPTEDDLQLLQLISNLSAIAIERGRMERSEHTYRALSHTLETLLNALPIQVALIDENGDIVRTNRLWKRFHVDHPAVAEVMDEGDNLLDRFPRVVGQSSKPVRVATGVQSVLRGATAQYVCEILLQRDDRPYWYQLAVVPVTPPDTSDKAGAVVMLTDITQTRKIAEELNLRKQEFKALAENAPDLVLRLDIEGRFLYANPAVGDVVGADTEAVIGSVIEQVWDSEAVATAWHRAIFTLFNTDSMREQIEFELDYRNGKRFYQAYLVPEYGSGRRSVMSVLAVIRDITNLKQAESHLRESQESLREMARSSAMLIERERKFIASELHDELGQLLTVLRMEVAMLKLTHGVDSPELQAKADEMTVLLDNCIQGMRKAIAQMRPMALDLGLVPAIEWLCDDFSRRHGIACVLSGLDDRGRSCTDGQCSKRGETCVREADGGIRLDDDRAIVVFRIVQESLTNIARHAGASRVEISLDCDGCYFRVKVSDDGRGFDLDEVGGRSEKRFGLLGMRERAFSLGGTLEIIGCPSQGTTVFLRIPNVADVDCCSESKEETA